MEEAMVPSLSSAGTVGSRFISENDVDTAKARRDEQWKAAYARLGQEPPPRPVEDAYDGRSLAEKLAANKIAKQEEWEEKAKLANQFRALEEDEIMFLDSVRERQEEEERQRKEKDGAEVKSFKEAVAARSSAANNPPPILPKPAPVSAPVRPAVAKKDNKRSLKGVLVMKKVKPVAKPSASTSASTSEKKDVTKGEQRKESTDDEPPDPKRRKIAETT